MATAYLLIAMFIVASLSSSSFVNMPSAFALSNSARSSSRPLSVSS
jgi:hypothetical protein